MSEIFHAAEQLHRTAQKYKALADVTRLRILGLLHAGELCVCDMVAVLQLPQSTVSRHLAYLRTSEWVSGRRKGKWMYYQLHQSTMKKGIEKKIMTSLAGLAQYETDHCSLKKHLAEKTEAACR
ncbi:ArsR/SmtB family transcription factor [Desulfocastanea catecholica]